MVEHLTPGGAGIARQADRSDASVQLREFLRRRIGGYSAISTNSSSLPEGEQTNSFLPPVARECVLTALGDDNEGAGSSFEFSVAYPER